MQLYRADLVNILYKAGLCTQEIHKPTTVSIFSQFQDGNRLYDVVTRTKI